MILFVLGYALAGFAAFVMAARWFYDPYDRDPAEPAVASVMMGLIWPIPAVVIAVVWASKRLYRIANSSSTETSD